ncbi:MAG: PAS domain-containing protein, partial [Chitinophagaceae bacterium]
MKELNILYLEDSAQDAELAGRILKTANIDFKFKLVDTREEYKGALDEYIPDVILADHSLFQFNSFEALEIFKSTGLKIPFILVTGTVSEEFAVNILKEGADDYLLKSNLVRLPNAILNSIEKYKLDRERQQYFNNIIANEALMKEAEQLAHFGSWESDVITGEMKWSDEMFRIYGYHPGEVKPGHDIILQHIHADERASYQNAISTYLLSHDTYASESRIVDKNGKVKFIFLKIVVTRNNEGQPHRLVGFVQDVTETRKLEKELADQALHQQKLITEVTIQAQEKERNELGRELHDNINQVLATVKMLLGMAVENAAKREQFMNRGITNINYAIEEIRKLSKSLVAPSLGDMGLVEALKELMAEINLDNNLQVTLRTHLNTEKKIDKNMELMLYRIAQEQLNNIRKYANAEKAVITLKTEEDNLLFSIADNGVGFDTKQKAHGIGLKNISSRVDFYSGKMDIISAPGKGCTININIPFKK